MWKSASTMMKQTLHNNFASLEHGKGKGKGKSKGFNKGKAKGKDSSKDKDSTKGKVKGITDDTTAPPKAPPVPKLNVKIPPLGRRAVAAAPALELPITVAADVPEPTATTAAPELELPVHPPQFE